MQRDGTKVAPYDDPIGTTYLGSSPPRPLRLLGPWPWYILSAAVVTLVVFTLLDLPFGPARRRAAGRPVEKGDGFGPERLVPR